MSIFQDVCITWKGADYTIKSDRVMGAIAVIEDHVTIDKVLGGSPSFSKMAGAFAALLRYAGAKASAEEVYASYLSDGSAESAAQIITTLQILMIPPGLIEKEQAKPNAKKPKTKAR
jgi:hypothetical protein